MKGARSHSSEGSPGWILQSGQTGFTLIELLTVITIISILASLTIVVTKSVTASAYKTREVNAARNLLAGLASSAADGDGYFLPGIDMRVNASTNPVRKPSGQIVTNSRAAQRYPFRIGPYLGNNFDGTILVNKNTAEIQKKAGTSGDNYDYYVSTYPALGMNVYCVGGIMLANGKVNFDADCITTQARMKGSVLAFASAGSGKGTNKIEGYCYVTPPTFSNDSPYCQTWENVSNWKSEEDPMRYGNVDFRYKKMAVCAFLDGSVKMCSPQDLSDMRLWSPNAIERDDAEYTIPR